MQYFTGSISHQLDAKNRIRIPKRYRSAFPENEKLYFMRYTKGCIAVLSESALGERLAALSDIKSDKPLLQQAKRAILSAVEPVEEDDQKRAVLSQTMRSHAGIEKDVMTVGMGDYLEIWEPGRFKESLGDMTLEAALEQLPF